MPVMRITVSFALPDARLHVLKRCAYLVERPFYGFLKSLIERQAKWAPPGERVADINLGIEIETTPDECAGREFAQQQVRETRELMRRLRDKGFKASFLRPSERLAA